MLDGRYVLVERVASGGTATVWRGRDERLGRMVAIKLLDSQLLDDELSVQRLRTEGQALARLRHRHIAEVYDCVVARRTRRTDPAAYLVMELVHGPSVGAVLSRHPNGLPWPQALAIAAQTAQGLAAAHARGIVHRDITPNNVLLAPGEVKIIDFGICAYAGGDELGSGGELVGTPAYLAPERIDGEAVRPAADVYSWGVLLFRMLTGDFPWRAETALGMLTAPRFTPPQPLPPIGGLPAEVPGLIAACLRRDPAARPTAAHIAETLAEHAPLPASMIPFGTDLMDEAASVTHILAWGPSTPSTRRGGSVMMAAVAGVTALSAGAALWIGGDDPGLGSAAAAQPAMSSSWRPEACAVTYQLNIDTGSRFTATITVTGRPRLAAGTWQISLDLPGEQRIDPGPVWHQDDRTVTSAERSEPLAAEAPVSLPVAGIYRGTNPLPTRFRLDGHPCVVTLLGPSGTPLGPPIVPPGVSPAAAPDGSVPSVATPGTAPRPTSTSGEPAPAPSPEVTASRALPVPAPSKPTPIPSRTSRGADTSVPTAKT